MAKAQLRITPDRATTLALEALGFLAAQEDAFSRFAGVSGLDPASAAARTGEAAFLAAVLDFLLSEEGLLVDFCHDRSIDPKTVHIARHVLGGP